MRPSAHQPHDRAAAIGLGVVLLGLLLDDAGSLGVSVLGLPLTLAKLSMGVLIGAVLLRSGRTPVRLPPPILLTGLLFLGAALTSAAGSVLPHAVWPRVLNLLTHLLLFGFAALGAQRVDPARLMVPWAVIVLGAIGFGLAEAGWRLTHTTNTINTVYLYRAQGTFTDPVDWMAALLLTTPVALLGLRARRDRFGQLLPPLLLAGLVVAAVASRSRAALVVLVASLPAIAFLLRQRPLLLLAATLLTLPGLGWFLDLPGLLFRFQALAHPSMEIEAGYGSLMMRQSLQDAAWSLWREHPWWGVGPGAFPDLTIDHHPGARPHWPHNTPLGLLAETGAVGLGTFVLFGSVVAHTMRQGLSRAHPAHRDVLLGALLALGSVAALSWTIDLWGRPTGWFVAGVGLGVALPIRPEAKN